jgi:hypothetical protein
MLITEGLYGTVSFNVGNVRNKLIPDMVRSAPAKQSQHPVTLFNPNQEGYQIKEHSPCSPRRHRTHSAAQHIYGRAEFSQPT